MMKLMSNGEVNKLKLNNDEFHMSHQKVYTFWYSLANDEVLATSSETVEQIEDIQRVGIPRVSKMNDSVLNKKRSFYTQF